VRNREGRCGRPASRAARLGGICAVAALGTAGDCAAQSPFADTPARSGTLTIPTSPSPASPFSPPPISATPTSPLRALPPGATDLPGAPSPAFGDRDLGDVPLPLPLPRPDDDEASGPQDLPPRPRTAPELSAARTGPVPKAEPVLLKSGMHVTLRICQLLPTDGLSSGERLLNGRPSIQRGDCFLAEVIEPESPYPVLVGGTVKEIVGPGRFGRPGHVGLQMTQLVQGSEHEAGMAPWRMETADRRFATRMRRALLTTLLGLEGAGTGASVGAQFSGGNMAFIGGGMGIGALVGFGYASFQRGTEPNLEPGDTFQIVVGTTEYRPVSREWRTILYPAADPGYDKAKRP